MATCVFCYFLYVALSFGIEQGTALRHLRQAGQAQGLGENQKAGGSILSIGLLLKYFRSMSANGSLLKDMREQNRISVNQFFKCQWV